MKRESVGNEYKWDLSDIYLSFKDWENDFEKVKQDVKKFKEYKGKLNQADSLYECLKLDEEVSLILEKLYVYPALKRDEDTTNNEAQRYVERASNLDTAHSEATSYITNEILDIEDNELAQLISEKKELKHYEKMLGLIQRIKKHSLSESEELLLAKLGDTTGVGDEVFTKLENADMKFPHIELENGEKVELTQSNYSVYVRSANRDVRQRAYEALYDTYMSYRNTIATTLYSHIKENVRYSQIRNYPSVLERSLYSDNVPKDVYMNLIQTTKKHLPALRKYLSIRKKVLGVDKLQMWDVYVPLLKGYEKEIPYNEAYEMMKEGLQVLGDDYVSLLDKAREERWIDVYENEGKRGGAYAWGSYGSHPYVLLNHKDDINSLFTLAHEMGHALHSYYSDEANPYLYAQYKIFVAEVASTVNEVLLMEYLLKKAKQNNDKEMEKYLLNYFLEQFRGTVYRQTMFGEFEHLTHQAVENEQPLMADDFKGIYRKLHEEYHGAEVVHDERISYEWMRIPHFYTSFYVYKYATGFSAAIAIAKAIMEKGEPAVAEYKKFLKSGGTDFPIELLKIAGVDMEKPEPIDNALTYFGELVDRFEDLMK